MTSQCAASVPPGSTGRGSRRQTLCATTPAALRAPLATTGRNHNGRTGHGWKAVIEFAPDDTRSKLELWPAPGADFEMMKKVKHMFDPGNLLNRGRLYRLI